MSTYTAAQSRYNACIRLISSRVPQLEAIAQGLTSAALRAQAVRLPVADATLDSLDSGWAALEALAPDQHLLPAAVSAPLIDARRLTLQARAAAVPDARRVVCAASARLGQALADGASELGRQEQLVVSEVAVQAAMNLGYRVGRCDGQAWTGVEAWRGHELILLTVGHGGAVEIDHAGLDDGSCIDRQSALQAEMSHLGVDLAVTSGNHHDRRGGVLIAAAAAHGDPHLARAAVIEKEGPPGTRPLAPEGDTGLSRREDPRRRTPRRRPRIGGPA